MTNAESSYHTDNSFGAEVLDYVGLLCLRTARSGGLSQMVSAVSVHDILRQRHPDALRTLYQPVHFDRRGGVRPGEGPTTVAPVFELSKSSIGKTKIPNPARMTVLFPSFAGVQAAPTRGLKKPQIVL